MTVKDIKYTYKLRLPKIHWFSFVSKTCILLPAPFIRQRIFVRQFLNIITSAFGI